MLAKLRMEVEESQFNLISWVLRDFELLLNIIGQLDQEFQNADHPGVVHVGEVVW